VDERRVNHHAKETVMKIIGVQRYVSPFVIAAVLLLQLSPALAAGQPDGQQATIQGSRVPGIPVAGTDKKGDRHHGAVEVTFTKWVTGPVFVPDNFGITEGRGLMEGFTAGDVPGTFVGEVLQGQRSANPALKAGINKVEAIYEVHDLKGNHVFTALIRGGTNLVTGAALLDGVVLAGWRTGAQVHVAFQTYAPAPTGPGCPDTRAPTDRNCFVGTIHVERAPED
jgi:hypothetical protein